VFYKVFQEACYSVIKDWQTTLKEDTRFDLDFLDPIKTHMIQGFQMLDDHPIVWQHKSLLHKHSEMWSGIFVRSTCLSCLQHTPTYKLPCQHFICENCVILFGDRIHHTLYSFSNCHLCKSQFEVSFTIHPPTASTSLLCVDGGGVRGVYPLMHLGILQSRLPIPIQRLFGVVFGTSSGNTVILPTVIC
jgi:hypothetical protein